jgi:hypothetical protein
MAVSTKNVHVDVDVILQKTETRKYYLFAYSETNSVLLYSVCCPEKCIDYRNEERKKSGKLRRDIGANRWVLTPSSRQNRSHKENNEPFSQEMHMKLSILSQDLILSNYTRGCGVSALHSFSK